MSISAPSSFTPLDRLKIWVNNVVFSSVARRISFSNDFLVTEDVGNNFFNIGLGTTVTNSTIVGSNTLSGDALTTTFLLPHALGVAPSGISVLPNSIDALGDFTWTFDAVNITVIYQVPPPTGASNLTWDWIATQNKGSFSSGGGGGGNWDPNKAESLTHKTITDPTNIFPSNFAQTNISNSWTVLQNFPINSEVNNDAIATLTANQVISHKDFTSATNVFPASLLTATSVTTLTNKNLTSGTNTFPSSLVTLTTAQALTNKNLTDATNTFPSSLATLTTVQALTHKDLTDATNTFPTKFLVNNTNNNFGAFYEDFQQIAPPATPPAGTIRLFLDNTFGNFLATIDSSGNKALLGLFPTIQNTQDNSFGAHFEELTEIVKPANPASGTRRVYVDSTTHALSSLDSGGTSHNLEAGGGGGTFTKGKATFSGNGSLKVFNIAHGLGSTPSSLSVTPGSDNANHGQNFPGDNEGAVWWATADATNITINYTGTAPVSGSSNLVYWWVAFA